MLVILVASAWSREESKSPLLRANYLSRRPNPLSARGTSSTTSTTAAIPTEEYVDDNGESDEERNDSNEDGSVAPDTDAKGKLFESNQRRNSNHSKIFATK